MAETVQNTYYETLMGVYIINPTTTIRALLTFLSPFLRKESKAKIHVCSLGPIDTINRLESLGVQKQDIGTLTRKFATI